MKFVCFVVNVGFVSQLYIPFHSGWNGRKISYRYANRYETTPIPPWVKFRGVLTVSVNLEVFRPVCFFGVFFILFFSALFLLRPFFFFFLFSAQLSLCLCTFSLLFLFFCLFGSSAVTCPSFFFLLSSSSSFLFPPSSLSVSVPLVDCPKNCYNFTACNEKPKQLSINFYLYGHLMLPFFKWAAKL